MIKALVVDDSGLMRIRISDVLRSDGNIKVVGSAKNGSDGLRLIKELRPDVVITDMVMPDYDGLFLVKHAMAQCPVPIIVLSSLERQNTQIFEALESGAFEFIDKPRSPRGLGFNKPLINLVKTATQVNTNTLISNAKPLRQQPSNILFLDRLPYDVIVVGASTGGPSAIECFLKGIPESFPVPVVIAQHMPPRFIESFADRLNNISGLRVQVAETGESLMPGVIYVCPGDRNTEVRMDLGRNAVVFGQTAKEFKEFNDPSIDCLFDSIGTVYRERALGIIMTGMGKDGTAGLVEMKKYGAKIVAQSEATCVVYGMPKAAVDAGVVDLALNIEDIAEFVTNCFTEKQRI